MQLQAEIKKLKAALENAKGYIIFIHGCTVLHLLLSSL